MKLKLLTTLSGPGGVARRGDERDFDDDEALRLIDAGIAEAVNPDDADKAKDSEKEQSEDELRAELLEHTRDELNTIAATHNVAEPDKLQNKEAVADAIIAARAAGEKDGQPS